MKKQIILLDGQDYARRDQNILKEKLTQYSTKLGLATVLLGDNSASHTYVQAKLKACDHVGVSTYPVFLPDDCSYYDLSKVINDFNQRRDVQGILVQLPLPDHINTYSILEQISPEKDVDCFHPNNLGKLFAGMSKFAPATPSGIMMLIDIISEQWQLESKHVVVISASNIVGKPVAMLMLHKGATVTIAHIKTKNLKELCLDADLIVSAAGHPNLITSSMVKEGVVIIDVGMNKIHQNGVCKLVGDVDFSGVKDKCFAITPVPGGVGPMTILALLHNLNYLYQQQTLLS